MPRTAPRTFTWTDERALDMLAHDLGWANISTELGAKVIKAPPRAAVLRAQGYTDEMIAADAKAKD